MKLPYKLLLVAGVTAFAASAQDKFDSYSYQILDSYKISLKDSEAGEKLLKDLNAEFSAVRGRAEAQASVFVGLEQGYSAADVEALGFEIISDIDDIVVVRGTVDNIMALADQDFVKFVSFGKKREPMMATARSVSGIDDIQSGTGLSQAYTGEGVIAGIWDTGMDVNHVNFIDADGKSRISRFWYFNGQGGSSRVYTSEDIGTFMTDDRNETHGTHTMGCMAGSWNGRGGGKVAFANGSASDASPLVDNPYYGAAPGAEIAASSGALYDPNTIAAVNNIAEYAKSVDKPVVINLSIGSNTGPHDGSDALGQALSNVAKKGAIICVSAGNEGESNLSVVKNFTSTDNSFSTFVNGKGEITSILEFWSSNSETFTLTVFVYNRNTKEIEYSYDFEPTGGANSFRLGYAGVSNQAFSKAFIGTTSYVSLTRSTNSGTNKRYSVTGSMHLVLNTTSNKDYANYALGFKVTGKNGQRVDLTANAAEFTNLGLSGYTNGSPDFSINDLACGPNVIAVGAWAAAVRWPTFDGWCSYANNPYKVGSVASFSSYGILADGRVLPDICAPGVGVISSISTYYYESTIKGSKTEWLCASQKKWDRDNYYYAESGTSMASPICSGTIALWLQANPYMRVDYVKNILKMTADTDVTASTPSYRWGGGKLDALAGMKYVIENAAGVNDVTADADEKVIITPTGDNTWEIYVPYQSEVSADVYSLSGVKMISEKAAGNTVNISAQNLPQGIYVVNVNGASGRKIVVR